MFTFTARHVVAIVACSIGAACATGDAAPGSPVADTAVLRIAAPPAVIETSAVVDSARPMATLIARFQAGVPRVEMLSNGATSPGALVTSFLDALAARDSTALASLFVSRAEFAHLYFPASELARPPYELDPALAWFQLSAESEREIRKTLSIFGGRSLEYSRHACLPDAPRAGKARLWRGCTVSWREPGAGASEASLFGTILEYEGRFKFFSYRAAR